mmetsp:Transcript_68936/g.194431  ORF Transcript_68936/g.194431 Transcript_68936/m.194431 type:complete len:358 (+) Transcript_68936:12-1085(+)
MKELRLPAEGSFTQKRGVVAWLVSNFSERDDDNSLFSAHLFRSGRLNWREYVDPDEVEDIQNRLQLLEIVTRNNCARFLEDNDMKTVPSNWGDADSMFSIQRVSQALYYKRLTQGELTHTQSECDIMTLLHVNLIPRLGQFVDAVLTAESLVDKPDLRFTVFLALMNTVFLFFRILGFLSQQQLTDALRQVREHYIVHNTGHLSTIQKTVVLAHVGLNCMGMAKWADISWLFDYLDSVAQELLQLQDNAESPERHVLLDVVAEVLSCYRYQSYHSHAALLYAQFIEKKVALKYIEDTAYEFRYFADEDLPSDHEAISLYHLIAAYPSGIPETEPPVGWMAASISTACRSRWRRRECP